MSQLSEEGIACDCSGLMNLLFEELSLPAPYALSRPKAVHYFSVLQEIGSKRIDTLKPGHLLAWRKDVLPKSGDTGHVLMVAGELIKDGEGLYRLPVFDASKALEGLSFRDIQLQATPDGELLGVRLHAQDSKVKRTAIYHAALEGSRYCFGCALPKRTCMCAHVQPSMIEPSVLIFRHPNERKRTASTVSLIKQRFPNVLVRDGEVFSRPRRDHLVLLFPGGETLTTDTSRGRREAEGTIVIIDATWRKAKKILQQNPWMKDLPRLSLAPETVSDYLIRKIPDANALSTVESFAAVSHAPELNDLFRCFIDRQIELMGEEVYLRNYRQHLNYPGD